MTQVKICGNTNPEDALLAKELGADYLGLIFAESKRKIDIAAGHLIRKALPDFNNFVGVFLNQPRGDVQEIASALDLKVLQFHGEETSRYCEHFMAKGFQVIKTFRIKDPMSLKRMDEYNVTAFLFDTFSKEEGGGTGKPFDWTIIEDKPFIHDRFFLAGGLNIENLQSAITRIRPFAVDAASGVEKAPGKKDPELLRKFIQIAKSSTDTHAQTRPIHP